MTGKTHALWISLVFIILVAVVTIAQAETANDQDVTVIYQEPFSSDPHWITNNPSSDYWDPSSGRYHFSIEPSTGGYAYVQIPNYKDTSFNLDYDLTLNRVDEGATFRMAFSGNEMNPEKGPSVLTKFTNAKFGQIMWLQVVTPGNKNLEINSQNGATSYSGSTIKYELNKTYHISIVYNKDADTVTTKVSDKQTGQQYWSYYVKTNENLAGMSRLWLGSIGDFGQMNIYAQGYLDNVQLTAPSDTSVGAPTAQATAAAVTPAATAPPTNAPTKKPTQKTTAPTPYPTATQSPLSPVIPLAGLGAAAGCLVLFRKNE